MIPAAIGAKLARLRLWEAILRLAWGTARWLAVAAVVLVLACGVDWLIERSQPTPWPLRIGLFTAQLLISFTLVALWIVRPLSRRLAPLDMALLVEAKHPELQNRLISVLQFHQPDAQIEGMSVELIAKVTEEAERQTATMRFADAADARRLGWALGLLLVPLAAVGGPLLAWPQTFGALLARQALLDVQLPRSLFLHEENNDVYPIDEEIVLRFRVTGPGVVGLTRQSRGVVRIYPEGLPGERFVLSMEKEPERGAAIFSTVVPAGYPDFEYRAWLGDGRTDIPLRIKTVYRPVINRIEAWAVLPEFVGHTPSGRRYERSMRRGDVEAIYGSALRVRVEASKPIKKARLEFLAPLPATRDARRLAAIVAEAGRFPYSLCTLAAVAHRAEIRSLPERYVELASVPMTVHSEGTSATVVADIPDAATQYRIVVWDEYGFSNRVPPVRTIRLMPEPPPEVVLLPEQFPPDDLIGEALKTLEDYQVDGAPAVEKGKIRIAYRFEGPYGVHAAKLFYRILRKPREGESEAMGEEPAWEPVELQPFRARPDAGPFLLELGVFANSPPDADVEFYALPSPDPERVPGGLKGGGRYELDLAALSGAQKEVAAPQPGDMIEFFVEVYADPKGTRNRPFARSEIRRKAVVTPEEAVQWVVSALNEESRIRQLRNRQQEVFGEK